LLGKPTALVESDDQPDEVADLGHPLVWTQFSNPGKPGMREDVDRHGMTLRKMVRKNLFYWSSRADQLFFVKVSGG
jgi:hypothetical protein